MFVRTVGVLIVVGLFVLFAAGQTPSPTVTPTPDTTPVPPSFDLPDRPMPSVERVGVDLANQMSLTLDDAIELALTNNNDIDASRNTAQISDFELLGAQGVYDPLITSENYFESLTNPTASRIGGALNGAVTQRRLFSSAGASGFSPFAGGRYSTDFNLSRTTTSNTNSFLNPQFPSSLTFAYVQPLLRNRKFDNNRRQIEIAKKNIELTDEQLRQRAIDVVASVERAYWDLVFALREQQVQTETLLQSREQLDSNKRLVAQGVLAPIELVAATSQILVVEQNASIAQEAVTRAENTLKTLIFGERTSPEWSSAIMPVSPADLTPPAIGLDVALAEAMRNRPELAQLDVTAEINRIDQRFFKDQTKPQVDLVGSYTTQGLAGTETPAAFDSDGNPLVPPVLVGGLFSSLGNLGAFRYPSYRVGVNISLPWGNRIAKANLGRSRVESDRIANTRAQTEQVIEAEVRNALQAVRSTEARLEAAIASRQAAEELYASEERQFRAGTTTFFLVLQRQNELTATRGREILARTNLNKAISDFHRAIGNTLTVNNVTVSK